MVATVAKSPGWVALSARARLAVTAVASEMVSPPVTTTSSVVPVTDCNALSARARLATVAASRLTVIVPLDVIGPPVLSMPVPPATSMLVTVPAPVPSAPRRSPVTKPRPSSDVNVTTPVASS